MSVDRSTRLDIEAILRGEELPAERELPALREGFLQNRRRSRRGLIIGVLGAAIGVAVLAAALVLGVWFREVPGQQRKLAQLVEQGQASDATQDETLRKINEIVVGLAKAESQRTATSKASTIALAVVVENLAAFAATPPAPDPDRLRSVEALCATAQQFRASVGDDAAPPCPAVGGAP